MTHGACDGRPCSPCFIPLSFLSLPGDARAYDFSRLTRNRLLRRYIFFGFAVALTVLSPGGKLKLTAFLTPLSLPALGQPIDPELYSYILSFKPEITAEMLGDKLNLKEPCLRNLRIAETLLKQGVEAGLTLYDIAW